MTVRHKPAASMTTSSTGRREADDTLGYGENGAKKAKVWRWTCCGRDRDEAMTVAASTDIPAAVTAGPYPGGLDFAARTSDHQAATRVVMVGMREGRLVAAANNSPAEEDSPPQFTITTTTPSDHLHHHHHHHHTHCDKLQPAPQQDKTVKNGGEVGWMMALQPARDRHEQNVEVVAEGGRLALHVLKTIRRGERLLLWYSDSLARAIGVPFLTPANIRGNQQYMCTSCHASFQYPNTLKAHIFFKCDSAATTTTTTRTPSPSLTTPSAFSSAMSVSTPFRLVGVPGPSAFHSHSRSSASSRLSPGSALRAREVPSVSSTRRRVWGHDILSPQRMCRSESSSSRKSVSDRRSMTPDSSTDDTAASALNLSTRKSACTSTVPALVCPNPVQHGSPTSSNSSMSAGGSVPVHSGQPIQIFNHIHPPPGLPALPIPLDQHMTWRLYYPWLAALPDPSPPKLLCTASMPAVPPVLDPSGHHHFACHPHNKGFMFPHFFTGPDPQSLLMTSTSAKPSPLEVSREALSGTLTHSVSRGESLTAKSSPGSSSKVGVPLIPVPSEKEGEPLDLLPPSFFANKSRKGHLCVYCGKLYSRKYGLKIHLRTHTGYKPLKCKVCLRPFGDPSNLNKHVRLHAEGDTPYRCDYCGKVLVRRRDLERHIRSRHPSVTEAKEEDDVSTECLDSEVDVTSDTESTLDGGEQEIEVT